MIMKIGTRASKLALAQAKWVAKRILEKYSNIDIDLVKIKTKGDRILNRPLNIIGGKGLFVKEIEDALIRKEIDLAVHSLKDVPAELPSGLCIGIIPEREDPRDVLISHDNVSIDDLPAGSSIGTSSLRRAAQLLNYRPDVKIVPLRGNLDTRIRKLHESHIQAIVVAAAGLKRLEFEYPISQSLSDDIMLPAIGQGALGLELRQDDKEMRDLLSFLDHYPTRVALEAERSFLAELHGGCQVPIAGLARFQDNSIYLEGLVAGIDGRAMFRDSIIGAPEKGTDLGTALANRLLNAGAKEILDGIYRDQ